MRKSLLTSTKWNDVPDYYYYYDDDVGYSRAVESASDANDDAIIVYIILTVIAILIVLCIIGCCIYACVKNDRKNRLSPPAGVVVGQPIHEPFNTDQQCQTYGSNGNLKPSVIVKLKESPASKSISKTKSSKDKDKDTVMVEPSALQIQDKTKEVPTSLITQTGTQEGKSLAGTPKSGGSNRPTQDNQTTTTPSAISKVFPQGTISVNHQPQPKSIRGETVTKTQDDQRTSAISKVFPQGTISKNQ